MSLVRAAVKAHAGAAEPPRYAPLGVRPCDVRAVGILDQVLTGGRQADPVYCGRRDGALIIAVECTERAEPVLAVDQPQAGHLARSARLIGVRGLRRCIAWCPAGIDITEEVSALASLLDAVTADEEDGR
jgi:hypothetical protein